MEKISIQEIQEKLFSLQDEKYRDFQAPLIPNFPKEKFIGVRTPELRKLAKDLRRNYDCTDFLKNLNHEYFDEFQLHAFILSEEKDFELCISELEEFLPYINNWATCDQCSPKVFKKNAEKVLPFVEKWISSERAFTVRFGISCLMQYFLDEKFKPEYLGLVSKLCRPHIENADENYYVNMMVSWYFATALAKQWDSTLPIIQNHALNDWCHKKTIQKARESFRISDEQKEILKKLK